jgi:hypothetical protein
VRPEAGKIQPPSRCPEARLPGRPHHRRNHACRHIRSSLYRTIVDRTTRIPVVIRIHGLKESPHRSAASRQARQGRFRLEPKRYELTSASGPKR